MESIQLGTESYAAARRFLEKEARDLEAALARFHFDGAPRDDAVRALSRFQNEDGGFGHAIEPDVRAPESSALGTSIALRVLQEIDALGPCPMIEHAARYLQSTFQPAMAGWRIVPRSVESSPHAPWWNQTGRDAGYDHFSLNPNAELLGSLYAMGDLAPTDIRRRVTEAVLETLATTSELEMHDLLCVLRLVAAPGLPDAVRQAARRTLDACVPASVATDPAAWAAYGLRPLQVVESPSSAYVEGLREAIDANLDYEIRTQESDGRWPPSWSWGDAYPEVWPVAAREWSGVITLQTLQRLDRFGRIERKREDLH